MRTVLPRLRRRAAWLAAAVVVVPLTAGCGGVSSSAVAPVPTATAVTFNQADVDFAAHMSQHHGQALLMTDLAASKAKSPTVKSLARRIAQQRAPEVDRFGAWLAAWGEAGGQMPPHGIGDDHNGPGMLTEAEISKLERLKASPFDRTFIDLMVRHHRGGMQLADTQIQRGSNPDAVRLAREIRTSSAAAVAEMLKIKKALSP